MADYVSIPVIVDAFQMTEDPATLGIGSWPDWIQTAIGTDPGLGSLFFMLGTTDGQKPVRYGDWIVRTRDGRLYVYASAEFFNLYQPA